MRATFGQSEDQASKFFHVALTTLELLSEMASATSLVVVIDDAQWLDVVTCDVRAFVARSLVLEPIVMLFAVRDRSGTPFDKPSLPDLQLLPLDDAPSAKLLDESHPRLAVDVRRQVLAEAFGNSLALLELPRAVGSGLCSSSAGALPLTERLESAFAALLSGPARGHGTLLLVAALEGARFSRRRTGASSWRAWRDSAQPDRILEQFVVASWDEHLRQQERVTERDQRRLDAIRAMTGPGRPPTVTHWLAAKPVRHQTT